MYKNKEDRYAWTKKWRERNREKLRERMRIWKESDPRRSLYLSARERARKFKLPFDITIDDIIIPEYCPVFPYLKLIRNKEFGKENSPTLDRIKPKLGYTKGNIAVISFKANRLKSNATSEDLESVLKYIKEYP